MSVKNWQWPPAKISLKDLFQEYGCDGSGDSVVSNNGTSTDSSINYNEIVILSKNSFVVGNAIDFFITGGKPGDFFKYSFDPINTVVPSLNSTALVLDLTGKSTVTAVANTLAVGQYELTVYFVATGNTRKTPLIVNPLPTTSTTTMNPNVFNPMVELAHDSKTLTHTLLPGSVTRFLVQTEFNDHVRIKLLSGPSMAEFKITVNDPNNEIFYIIDNLSFSGEYISNYITLDTLGLFKFTVEFQENSFAGTMLNGRIRIIETHVSLPVTVFNETVVLSPSYWTVGNSSSLRIFGGRPNTGFKYSIEPPNTATPGFGTQVFQLDTDGKFLISEFGTATAVGNYELCVYFIGSTNIRRFTFTVATATVSSQAGLWSIQVLPLGEISYVPATPGMPSPFNNSLRRIFNEGDTITFRITAPKTYTHWWKTLGSQYGIATGSSVLGAGPTPPVYNVTAGHEIYFGLGAPRSVPTKLFLTATKTVDFHLRLICNGALNDIVQSGFTGGSGQYQIAIKLGSAGGPWFTSIQTVLNPTGLTDGRWYFTSGVYVKTSLPNGTYWFAARDINDFNNVIAKSITVDCDGPCTTNNAQGFWNTETANLNIWDTDIDINSCVPEPVIFTNPYPVDVCYDNTLRYLMKVRLNTATGDGTGFYGDATIRFKSDLRNDDTQFFAPFVDDPQLYQAAKITYNSVAYRRVLTWGNIIIENTSNTVSGSGTLTDYTDFMDMADLPDSQVYLVFRLIGGGGAGGAPDIVAGSRQISMGGRGAHGGVVHGIVKLPATPGQKKKLRGGVGRNGGSPNAVAQGWGFSSSSDFRAQGALGGASGSVAGISGQGGQGGGATSLAYQVGSTVIPIATAGGGGGGGGASFLIQSDWVKSGRLHSTYGDFITAWGISTYDVNATGTFTFKDLFYAKAGTYKITYAGDNFYTIKIDNVLLPNADQNFIGSNFHLMTIPVSGDKIIDVSLTNPVFVGQPVNPNSIAITVEYLGIDDLTGQNKVFNFPRHVNVKVDFACDEIALSTVITVELWAAAEFFENTTNSAGADGMFFGFLRYSVWTRSGTLGFNTSNGDVYGISSTRIKQLNLHLRWTHYVFVMNVGDYTVNKIYINGQQETLNQQFSSQANVYAVFNNGVGRIGGWRTDNNYQQVMDLAIFKIYNRALTQAEITAAYTESKSRFDNSQVLPGTVISGLVLHYDASNPLCYSGGTEIRDLTAFNNNAVHSVGTTVNIVKQQDYGVTYAALPTTSGTVDFDMIIYSVSGGGSGIKIYNKRGGSGQFEIANRFPRGNVSGPSTVLHTNDCIAINPLLYVTQGSWDDILGSMAEILLPTAFTTKLNSSDSLCQRYVAIRDKNNPADVRVRGLANPNQSGCVLSSCISSGEKFSGTMIWTTLDFLYSASVGRPQFTDRISDVYTGGNLNGTQGQKPNADGGGGGGGGGNAGQGGLGGTDRDWNPGVITIAQGGSNGRASKNTTVVLNNSNWIYFDYIQPKQMLTSEYGNNGFYGSGGLYYDTDKFLDTAGIYTRTTPGAPGAISYFYTTDISKAIDIYNSSDLTLLTLPDMPRPVSTISFKNALSINVDALMILYIDGSAKYTFDVWDQWSSIQTNGIGYEYEFRLDYVSGDITQFNAGDPRDFRGRPILQAPSPVNQWVNFDGKIMLYWRAQLGSSHNVNVSVKRRSDGFIIINSVPLIISGVVE